MEIVEIMYITYTYIFFLNWDEKLKLDYCVVNNTENKIFHFIIVKTNRKNQ